MNTESKHTEWILETIDHLRRRKARPDLQRICHVVRRNFGLQAAETEVKLEKLVDTEIVIKVDYKGSTSYRNAAKWRKSMLSCAVQNSKKVSTKIIEAIIELTKTKTEKLSSKDYVDSAFTEKEDVLRQTETVIERPTSKGASFQEINSWLQTHFEGYKLLKSPMTVILKREIDAGRICKLDDGGAFILTKVQRKLIKNDTGTIVIVDFPQKADSHCPMSEANSGGKDIANNHRTSAIKLGIPNNGHQPAKRGRPPKSKPTITSTQNATSNHLKPPKLKRTASTALGRELGSSHPAKVLKKELHNAPDVCDICRLHSGGKGKSETLLHCSDCAVKAHPSCLKYNPFLASNARKGPWQCNDCKTCCVCHDSGQADQMLFCDGCDKGYHMTCHQPSVMKKPSGLWECYECRLENSTLQRSEFYTMHNHRNSQVQDSAPPTPTDSPEPNSSSQNRTIYPDASKWAVNDVVEFFTSAGFSKEAKIFQEQDIDGIAVLLLRRGDVLKGLDLKLGPALKINRLVEGLQTAKQRVS